MGVWIETIIRRRAKPGQIVTPFVGVWIETGQHMSNDMQRYVTPFVGVWIETYNNRLKEQIIRSHPSWVCGLKLCLFLPSVVVVSHTLRGCVD